MLKELIDIQKELKAPKGQYNSFGKYNYRSAEDILEAVKPLVHKKGCYLTVSDSLEYVGDRYYIKATATIVSKDGEKETTTAYAREEETKKGMDGSQITGTASSYARKYALNGLFCIDDTKDADTDEYTSRQRQEEPTPQNPIPKKRPHRDALAKYCKDKKVDMNEVAKMFNLSSTSTEEQFEEALKELKASENR